MVFTNESDSTNVEKIDKIDVKLITILQKQGRRKRNELAEEVQLSVPSVSEQLRKLEQRGIIEGYAAVINAAKIQLGVTAYIFITSDSSKYYDNIIEHAAKEEEILECHAITGEGSHILKVRTRNTSTLEQLLSRIQSWKGVKSTRTDVVLSSPKESASLPLKHLSERNK